MIRIGIMGLGNIAHRVAQGVLYAEHVELYAVASRDKTKAEAFKDKFGACLSYDSYAKMLTDEQVDLVYICTPNALHYEHICLALQHHKHVLCEKPLVTNMRQLDECFAYAKTQHCFLMEAEKTLFTPLNKKIKKMVDDGVIGKLRYIDASYGFLLDEEQMGKDFWGFQTEDGGCMYDVGVYPLCYANYFAGSTIQQIQCTKEDAELGYTRFAQVLLNYRNGILASVRSAWYIDMMNYGCLYGDKGRIVCNKFWKNSEAELFQNDVSTAIKVEMKSEFSGEIDHAAECIGRGLLESPILNQQASREIMRVLEFVKNSQTTKTNNYELNVDSI